VQRRAGDRRGAGEQATRASGGAWLRWKCKRWRWLERGRFKRGGPSADWFGGSSLPPDHLAVRLKNRRFNTAGSSGGKAQKPPFQPAVGSRPTTAHRPGHLPPIEMAV